jgi:hypothetical protein
MQKNRYNNHLNINWIILMVNYLPIFMAILNANKNVKKQTSHEKNIGYKISILKVKE